MIEIKIFKIDKRAITPKYATLNSACFDLHACLTDNQYIKAFNEFGQPDNIPVNDDEIYVPAENRVLVPTGIIFGIPENHYMRLYIRSGIAYKHGLILGNSVGIIDSDYPEQTYVMLSNPTSKEVKIQHGDRIAQAEIVRYKNVLFEEVNDNPVIRTNRISGLGSTGK